MKTLRATTIVLTAMLATQFAAPVAADDLNASATIGNLIPVVESIGVAANVAPTSGGTVNVPITLTVKDDNGHQDLSDVRVTVLKPDDSTVHIVETAATSNNDGSGVSITYSYDFDMQYYDDPGVYHIKAEAEDATGAISLVKDQTFTYDSLAALALSTSSLSFGAIDPGVASGVQTVTVSNHGNVQIDLVSSGTALDDGAGHSIAVDRMDYDLTNSDMSTKQDLTSSPFTNTGFDLAHGASSTKSTHWQLDTPSGEEQYLPAGSYTGTVTLAAVQG